MIFPGTHDPADISNYAFDFAGALDTGEALATQAVAVDAAAAALGVTLGVGSQASSITGTQVKFWVSVAAGFQGNAAFVAGLEAAFTITVTTTASPARTLERTARLRLQQSDSTVEPVPAARSYTTADLNAINAAIASGATTVRYADGSMATYRTLAEMIQIREIIRAEVAPPPVAAGVNSRASLAYFG
jgi:hypothetical protein